MVPRSINFRARKVSVARCTSPPRVGPFSAPRRCGGGPMLAPIPVHGGGASGGLDAGGAVIPQGHVLSRNMTLPHPRSCRILRVNEDGGEEKWRRGRPSHRGVSTKGGGGGACGTRGSGTVIPPRPFLVSMEIHPRDGGRQRGMAAQPPSRGAGASSAARASSSAGRPPPAAKPSRGCRSFARARRRRANCPVRTTPKRAVTHPAGPYPKHRQKLIYCG